MLALTQKLAAPSKFMKLIFCCCKGECKNIYGYIDYNLHCTVYSDVQRVQWGKLDQFPEETDEAYDVDDELNVDYRFKINNNEF